MTSCGVQYNICEMGTMLSDAQTNLNIHLQLAVNTITDKTDEFRIHHNDEEQIKSGYTAIKEIQPSAKKAL